MLNCPTKRPSIDAKIRRSLAVIAISAAHVLGEGGNMLECVRGQSRLPRAQPVPIGATHGVERAVLLAAHGAR